MNNLDIILILTVLHYIADYPLQGEFLGVQKSNYTYLLFVHCVIWTGVVSFGMAYLGIFAYWKVIFLFIGHFVIDYWKCKHPNNKEIGLTKLLWIDQFLHFIQLVFVLNV